MSARSYAAGEIAATIGDNEPHGTLHRGGYNGLFSLTSVHEARTAFVPLFAGMNFEHVFDGSTDEPDPMYDPRRGPMTLEDLGGGRCRLYQPTTPCYGLESWTEFSLAAPHAVDMSFTCIPRRRKFAYGYLGLFWASYIDAPENKAIVFRGVNPRIDGEWWLSLQNQFANRDASVVHRDVATPGLPFVQGSYGQWWLPLGISPLRWTEPFFFGLFHGMVLVFMFERTEGLRFAQSSYGGETFRHEDFHNPAWDFSYILPDPRVGTPFSFRCRLLYKTYVDREDVRAEYRAWRSGLVP